MRRLLVTDYWRWLSRVDVRPEGCWLWTGSIGRQTGYGTFNYGHQKGDRAHRFGYEVLHGPVPEGMELDHLCRVRACVRPSHLEAVTHRENMRRGRLAATADHPERFVPSTPRAPLPRRLCSCEGCDRNHYAKGLCIAHYRRQRRLKVSA